MQVAYATVAIPQHKLQAGMFVAGRLNLYGLKADVAFQMTTGGVQLQASVNFSEVCRCGKRFDGMAGPQS